MEETNQNETSSAQPVAQTAIPPEPTDIHIATNKVVNIPLHKVYYALFFAAGFIVCLIGSFIVQRGIIKIDLGAINTACDVDFKNMNIYDLEESFESILQTGTPEKMYEFGMYMSKTPGQYSSYGIALISLAADEGSTCAQDYLKTDNSVLTNSSGFNKIKKDLIKMREKATEDPAKRLGDARNAQRRSDVNTLLNALYQYAIDNNGTFPAGIPEKMSAAVEVCSTNGPECKDMLQIADSLTKSYLVKIPADPSLKNGVGTSYSLFVAANGRITIESMTPENNASISVTR